MALSGANLTIMNHIYKHTNNVITVLSKTISGMVVSHAIATGKPLSFRALTKDLILACEPKCSPNDTTHGLHLWTSRPYLNFRHFIPNIDAHTSPSVIMYSTLHVDLILKACPKALPGGFQQDHMYTNVSLEDWT